MSAKKKYKGFRSDEIKKLDGDGLSLKGREIGKGKRRIERKETQSHWEESGLRLETSCPSKERELPRATSVSCADSYSLIYYYEDNLLDLPLGLKKQILLF